jgi:haloalkane dehalogenase
MDAPWWVDAAEWPWPARPVDVGEGALATVEIGDGPLTAGLPLVLVHGTPTWSFEWRHLIRGLPDRRLIAFDHLGFGLSDRPDDAGYRPEDHARRFGTWVEAMGLERFDLVVHDFGGPIALSWAVAHPERINRLVVLNSWMWAFDDDSDMQRKARIAGSSLGRFLYTWANASLRIIGPSAWGDRRKLTPAIQAHYLAPFRERSARGLVLWALARSMLGSRDFFASTWDRRAALADVPSLVIWGLADSAFRPHQLAKWRVALPHARVVELAASGHWPHEEDPEGVLSALRPFLG